MLNIASLIVANLVIAGIIGFIIGYLIGKIKVYQKLSLYEMKKKKR